MLKSLIPPSSKGRLLLVAALVLSAAVYGLRLLVTVAPDPSVFISILAGMLVLFAVLFILLIIKHGIQTGGHLAPMIVLVLGILMAILLPTPSPYTEQPLFETHRKEFEVLVELAANHRLNLTERCEFDNLPATYAQLIGYCIKVDNWPFFSVQFGPTSYEEIIVYIEDPARIHEVYGCDRSDSLIQQLDRYWFSCSRGP
jgi:hypothetical protein